MRVAVAVVLASTAGAAADELLVCGWNNSNVVVCDVETSDCASFVSNGAGGLALAHSIEIGPAGDLFVTSFSNHRVNRYEGGTGAFLGAFVASGSGGLGNPTDGVFGPDGDFYVTSFGTDCVLRYDGKTGAPLGQFVTSGSGGLLNPESLAFGPDGHLYVASGNNANVLRYDGATGAFLGVFVPSGSGGLSDPHFLFFHEQFLYVTTFGNHKVLRFDAFTGTFVDVFVQDDPSTPGEDESGGLLSAHGAAFGPDGMLYVASFANDRVLRYDGTTGAFVDMVMGPGDGVDGPIDVVFRTPSVAGDVNGDGVVNVLDLITLLGDWGLCGGGECPADLNGDGQVNVADLLLVLTNWST